MRDAPRAKRAIDTARAALSSASDDDGGGPKGAQDRGAPWTNERADTLSVCE
jgi:hypothetical protein